MERNPQLDLVHRDALHQTDWSRVQTSAFLQRLTGGLGSRVNSSAIANDLRTSANTVRRRITALQEAFVLWPCHRSHNLEPQLRAQEKLYFTDPIFTRLQPDSSTDSSLLSEQQLGVALLRALEREEPGTYLEFDRVCAVLVGWHGSWCSWICSEVSAPRSMSAYAPRRSRRSRSMASPLGSRSPT